MVMKMAKVNQDDDGDGTPDISEEAETSEESSSESPIVIMLFVGLYIAAAAFMLRRNKTEVE